MNALAGRVLKIRTMSNGSPRIELELDCSLAELAQVLDVGAEVAIARLTHQPLPEAEPEDEKPKGGELAKLAGRLCESPEFRQWLSIGHGSLMSPEGAAMHVRSVCGVLSRAGLDHDKQAAQKFHEAFRRPFLEWKNKRIESLESKW